MLTQVATWFTCAVMWATPTNLKFVGCLLHFESLAILWLQSQFLQKQCNIYSALTMNLRTQWCILGYWMTLHQLRWFFYHCILNVWLYLMNLMGLHSKWAWSTSFYYPSMEMLRKAKKKKPQSVIWMPLLMFKHLLNACHNLITWGSMAAIVKEFFKFSSWCHLRHTFLWQLNWLCLIATSFHLYFLCVTWCI